MSKHTPGPWWRDADGFIAGWDGDEEITIADANCNTLDIDEREANTELIAAAPELLKACEFAVAYFANNSVESEWRKNEIATVLATAISMARTES